MAVRRPLKVTSAGHLQEMTDAEIDGIKAKLRFEIGVAIGAGDRDFPKLTVGSGNIANLADTRKKSGTAHTNVSAFPSEATTGEPQTVTVNYNKIIETSYTKVEPTDTDNKRWPLYYSGGNLHCMSSTDVMDTFIEPAIDLYVASSTVNGAYYIHTSTSLTNYTNVSSTAVFRDTRANVSSFLASNIGGSGTTQDFASTITNYYLMRRNDGSTPSHVDPVILDSNNNPSAQLGGNALDNGGDIWTLMQWAVNSNTGTKIRWRYNTQGSGTNLGTGMTNTILDGSGNRQTRYVNTNDYRAQEFPNGSATTANTYYLRVYKA